MSVKRILPWNVKSFGRGYEVTTRIADFSVLPHAGWFVAWVSTGISRNRLGSFFDTFELAMDACEADYVSRCTEFLTLYNPATHVVVSREALRGIQQAFANAEKPVHIEVSALAELRAALEVK